MKRLRGRLAEAGVTQREMAILIKRIQKWVTDLLQGRAEPTLSDIWNIMDVLHIDAGEMARYFPRRRK